MAGSVFVDPGDAVALDRASLSAPAPETTERLLEFCSEWADEVGWTLAFDPSEADAVIVGPEVTPPPGVEPVVHVERAQGVDGFRWGIRHFGYSQRWPYETVPYGLIDDQLMDVRRARRDPRGVAVLLHGGFWMEAWRRDLMDGIAVDLAERGWETWNVEYGRVGGTGGWPQSVEDVLSAIDTVCKESATDVVTLIGHSAGAQLALAAAARNPERIERVVSLAGLCDLDTARDERLGGGAVDRLLDGAPIASASPLHLLPLGVPVLLAHCADDSVVPIEQSRRYAEAAADAGDDVELLELDEGDHMSLIEPESGWRDVVPALLRAHRGG